MDKEHIVNIKGKEYIKYSGLLDLAHKKGLLNLWIVSKEVDWQAKTALVQVKAQFLFDDEYSEWEALGSASPENTSLTLNNSFPELAHTRAKARVLRDALNINAVSIEEVGE